MKVLSLCEPWASLVVQGVKKIETRSWKTSYRGELYIHASKAKVNSNDVHIRNLIHLLDHANFQLGYIIGKCNLVDIQFMDEVFLQKIQKNSVEYICGEYSYGRYAWILDNITMLKEPIPANGKLRIWEYQE